jgi:hypothetical protein
VGGNLIEIIIIIMVIMLKLGWFGGWSDNIYNVRRMR